MSSKLPTRCLLILFAACTALFAQTQEERVRGAMAESISKQRESVRVQLSSIRRPPAPPSRPVTMAGAPVRFVYSERACAPLAPASLETDLRSVSEERNVSADLLRAVIANESGYVPCAISNKGALGLMQLMPTTAESLGVTDPFDAQQSLRAGASYLAQLIERYGGNLSLALAAYNAGPANVDKFRGIPPFGETQQYVGKILSQARHQ